MDKELIALICPSCGGKLEVLPNTISFECENCGNRHLVRQGEEEKSTKAFCQCPQCQRNDKVEKVSSIVATQKHTVTGTRPVTNYYTDNDGQTHSSTYYVGFTDRQTSDLARNLTAPEKPIPPSKPSRKYVILGGVIATFYFIMGIATLWQGGDGFMASMLIVMISVIGTIVAMKYNKKALREDYPRLLATYDKNLIAWENALNRWNQLYYCFRDDCVFTLGANDYAKVSKMKLYLYQNEI